MYAPRLLSMIAVVAVLLAGSLGFGIFYRTRAPNERPVIKDDTQSPPEEYQNLSLAKGDRELL